MLHGHGSKNALITHPCYQKTCHPQGRLPSLKKDLHVGVLKMGSTKDLAGLSMTTSNLSNIGVCGVQPMTKDGGPRGPSCLVSVPFCYSVYGDQKTQKQKTKSVYKTPNLLRYHHHHCTIVCVSVPVPPCHDCKSLCDAMPSIAILHSHTIQYIVITKQMGSCSAPFGMHPCFGQSP